MRPYLLDLPRAPALYIRLCSLRTGLAHPSARLGIIPIQLDFSVIPHQIYSTVSLVVSDELLLISLIAHDLELCYDVLVWDWQAGALLMRTGWRIGLCGAACLDDNRLVVFEAVIPNAADRLHTEPDAIALLVYDAIRTPDSHDENTGSRFHASDCRSREPTLQLDFPPLGISTRILATDFLLRAAPVSYCSTLHTPELLPKPTCRTLSLSMRLFINDISFTFLVFVDSSKLLAHLAQAKIQGQTLLPWEAWGEYSTRWIRYLSDPNPWINWIHGTRYVLGRQVVDDQPEIEGNPYIAVADFHAPTVRRFNTRLMENYVIPSSNEASLRREAIRKGQWAFFGNYLEASLEDGMLAVDVVGADTPTIIEDLGPTPIVSRLPYRLVVARPAQPVSGCKDWMIDENRIVGVGVRVIIEVVEAWRVN
jgi:hypothetical protein